MKQIILVLAVSTILISCQSSSSFNPDEYYPPHSYIIVGLNDEYTWCIPDHDLFHNVMYTTVKEAVDSAVDHYHGNEQRKSLDWDWYVSQYYVKTQ